MVRRTVCEKVDDFSKNAILENGFWLKKEIPTLPKIIQTMKGDPDLPSISRSSFQKLLKDVQFE